MDDIEFTFNPDSFLKGVKKITDSVSSFKSTATDKLDSVLNSVSRIPNTFNGIKIPNVFKNIKLPDFSKLKLPNLSDMKIPDFGKLKFPTFGESFKSIKQDIASVGSAFLKMFGTGGKGPSKPFDAEVKKIQESSGQMSSMMIAKGMIIAQVLMGAFKKAFNFIKNGLPEVGKSMSIAGDIIQRNLFWPLRKELAPILQKMLDWVRDHRAMFVRWGGVLVNVFRAITTVAKGFVNMISAIFTPVANKLKSLFGGVAGGITDIFNIVLFKLTSVIMFLQVAFMPLISQIGDALAVMIGWVSEFFGGFAEGVSGVTESFSDLISMLNELCEALTLSDGGVNLLGASFRTLGDFIGTVLYGIISGLANMIDGLTLGIKNLGVGIRQMKAVSKGDFAEVKRLNQEALQNKAEFDARYQLRANKMQGKASDFVNRTEARFSPNAGTSSKQVNASSKVTVEQINITVAKDTDPKKAGEGFIEGMNKKNSDMLRNMLMNQSQAQGN